MIHGDHNDDHGRDHDDDDHEHDDDHGHGHDGDDDDVGGDQESTTWGFLVGRSHSAAIFDSSQHGSGSSPCAEHGLPFPGWWP